VHEAENDGVSSSTDATAESMDEGARVALRALEEVARLVATETRTEDRVADLDAARARIRRRESFE
jgi:hypothetical protein